MTDVSVPFLESVNAEMMPLSVAVLWALETNNWSGPVGRNSLPNGAQALCLERRAGAAVRRPPKPTVKLSI